MTKDYTKQADELARKIARRLGCCCKYCEEINARTAEVIKEEIHSHTDSTLAELLANDKRIKALPGFIYEIIKKVQDRDVSAAHSGPLPELDFNVAIDQAVKEEK